MFYAIYGELCHLRGESPSRAAENMGVNRATVTFWKKDGFSPRQATLNKIASYLVVPPAFLLGETLSPCPLCGASGDNHDRVHAQMLAAAKKFGFCWHEELCAVKMAESRRTLRSSDDPQERCQAIGDWLVALFSQSLRRHGFSLDHPTPPAYYGQLLAVCPPDEWLSADEIARSRLRFPPPRRMWAAFAPVVWDPPQHHPLDLLPLPPTAGHIPLLGSIAAGAPLIASQHIVDWIPASQTPDEGAFALRVQGDSMIGAGIYPDSIAILRKQVPRDGQIAACLLDGEDVTLKRVKFTPEGVWLLPENPAYTPRLVAADAFRTGQAAFLGVLLEVRLTFA